MEAIIELLQAIQLNILEMMILGLFIFGVGFWIGNVKAKRLSAQVHKLERDVLDLNAEILYGSIESESCVTPVIEIKLETLKSNKIAK